MSNQLGPGISVASLPELGPGGSWSTCLMGCNQVLKKRREGVIKLFRTFLLFLAFIPFPFSAYYTVAQEPPQDVAHLQFKARIAFKLVWCPPKFDRFVLVDDDGILVRFVSSSFASCLFSNVSIFFVRCANQFSSTAEHGHAIRPTATAQRTRKKLCGCRGVEVRDSSCC